MLFKKKKKEKEDKQPLEKVIKNNFYGFSILFKSAPGLVLIQLIRAVTWPIVNFICGTLMLRQIINNFQNQVAFEATLFMILAAYLFRTLVDITWDFVYGFITPKMNLRLKKQIDSMMHEKLISVELGCYEDKAFYDKYVQVASDVHGRIDGIFGTMRQIISTFTSLSANALLLFTIDPWLIVFTVIPLITTTLLGKWDGKHLFNYQMELSKLERQRDYSRRTFYLSDYAKEMRLSHMGEVMQKRFSYATETIIKFMKGKLPLHAFIQFLMGFIRMEVCVYGAMLFSAYRTLVSKTMLFGDCLVVVRSVSSTIYQINEISKNYVETFTHSLYIDNLKSFLAYEPKLKGGEYPVPKGVNLFEMKDIHFRYEGQEKNTIRGVNISIAPGEKIALVGHNGAGKTTLAKLMLRLYDPTCGTVTYGGRDIKEYKLDGGDGYRDRFAVVFQDFKLFSMSVADNVLMRNRTDGDEELVEIALQQSGATEKVNSLEHGVDTILTREFDDKGVVLSGGEGQKIAISRAFAKDAEIVILDEPSSALDPVAEYKMYDNMLKACENRSVVFISHRISSATLADTIYLLEDGKVAEKGSHSELMKLGGKYAEMFRIQAENYVTEGEKNEEE